MSSKLVNAPVVNQLQGEAANDDTEAKALCVIGGRLDLSHAELEALANRLRSVPRGSPEANATAQTLLLAVRGIIVVQAQRIARRFLDVALADLVNVGCAQVLADLPGFEPGRAEGKSLLPGWTAKVASRAMRRYAQEAATPVTVSKHARQQHARAREADPELGPLVGPAIALDGTVEVVADAPSAEDRLIEAQLLAQLEDAIEQLPSNQARILGMTYGLDGMERIGDDRRIAKALGLTVGEVQRLRSQALTALRSYYGEE